jgi:hypothetical protein
MKHIWKQQIIILHSWRIYSSAPATWQFLHAYTNFCTSNYWPISSVFSVLVPGLQKNLYSVIQLSDFKMVLFVSQTWESCWVTLNSTYMNWQLETAWEANLRLHFVQMLWRKSVAGYEFLIMMNVPTINLCFILDIYNMNVNMLLMFSCYTKVLVTAIPIILSIYYR